MGNNGFKKTKRSGSNEKWFQFIHRAIITLQPEQVFSGYEIGNTAGGENGSFEADITERIFADYFYGLAVDHPKQMALHGRGNGLFQLINYNNSNEFHTPTWSFLLSPYWIDKLRLTEREIRAKLDDPRITITKIAHPTDDTK